MRTAEQLQLPLATSALMPGEMPCERSEQIGRHRIWEGDCEGWMKSIVGEQVDVVVTSPPYNRRMAYATYQDSRDRAEYLLWLRSVFEGVKHVLVKEGSFFLNVNGSSNDPWLGWDVAAQAREAGFVLQNSFAWVKSISIPDETVVDGMRTIGHFQPINSLRYVNQAWEPVYHFTKTGDVKLDRLAIGVSYMDKSNLKRGTRGKHGDIRCRGDVWFIPYETVQSTGEKGKHPAVFPVGLPLHCIKLHGCTSETKVLDPFMGTGSTLIAAEAAGCKSWGIDIDGKYYNWTRDRLRAEVQSRGGV